MEQLDFSGVEQIEVPVKGPDGKDYMLREATGAAIIKYQEANLSLFQSVINDEEGTRTVRQVKAGRSTDAVLVALCLFDGEGKPVPLAVVQAWPAKAQRTLFDKAEEISDLDDEAALPGLLRSRDKLNRRIAKLEGAAKNVLLQPAP